VAINSKHEHVQACRWITTAIILHNMMVDWEGNAWNDFWREQYNGEGEFDPHDGGEEAILDEVARGDGQGRRQLLVEELVQLQ
jgi:hypothetical protein